MKYSVLLIIKILISSVALCQIDDVYIVEADKLNLRQAPNSNSVSYGLLSKGAELIVMDVTDEWYKVEYGDHIGWVNRTYLKSKKGNSYVRLNLKTGDSPECDNMSWKFDHNAKTSLKINVGKGADFAIKLMEKRSNDCIRAFYVRSGENVSLNDIPEGYYYLKIANGLDFRQGIENGICIMLFNRNANYQLGSDLLDFNVSPKRIEIIEGKRYEVQDVPKYELSLDVPKRNKALGDDLNTNKITLEEFNK